MNEYSKYLGKAFSAKTKLYWCGLSLSEIARQIEENMREAFDPSGALRNKEYRHNNLLERKKVVQEVKYTWDKIKSGASSTDIWVNEAATNRVLGKLDTQQVDVYDLFLLEAAANAGITQVISDDGDFASVSGIQLFTANQNVIQTASIQGKLVRR